MFEKINTIFFADESTNIYIFDKTGINNYLSEMYNNLMDNKMFNINDYLNLTYYFNVKMYNAYNTGNDYLFIVFDDVVNILWINPHDELKYTFMECYINDNLNILDINTDVYYQFKFTDDIINFIKKYVFDNYCFPVQLTNECMETINCILNKLN